MAQQFIPLSILPMEDIINYMQIIGGFRKKDDIANDTRKVARIDAEKIAIAAMNEEGELINDRNTVINALRLAGQPAENYLTRADSSDLMADTHKVSTIVSNEISAIRDEMYQMKNELVKNGYLKGSNVYNGFYDPFRKGEIKYISKEITKVAQADSRPIITDITVLDSTQLMVGEYIAIKSGEKTFVCQIKDKQGKRLTIDPKITGPLDEFTSVYKTLGTYNSGEFVFGKETKSIVSSNERTAILKDGKIRKTITELNDKMNGFATTIMIPISMPGMLKKISVSLAASGNPGAIKASIYEVDTASEENNKILVGESDTRLSSEATIALRDLVFNFPTEIPVKSGKDYIVLLSTTFCDAENKWYIGGYDEPCHDGVHKDCYNYIDGNFVVANETADMFISITTNEIIDNQLKLFKHGLYSMETDIYNQGFTRVRVELKVNREGRFRVIDSPNSLICDSVTALELVNEDGKSYGSAGIFNTGDTISVGGQIARVGSTRVNNSSFTLEKPTYCAAGSECYRIGYSVQAIARQKVISTENALEPVLITREKLVELPLVSIIPGKEGGKEEESSDRLIFEAEVEIASGGYKLIEFNNLEVQVKWETTGVNEEELQHYSELGGKIFDISIATDSAYNKKDMD